MPDPSLQPVTLQQVADSVGVSVSTASRILTGKAAAYRISSSTEESVRKTAERLGFRHSQVARSLRSRKSGLIGVVLPDVSNPFFAAIAREVTLAAEASGFSVLLADSREDTATEQHLIEQLRARMIEGLVVCPVGKESSHLETAFNSGLPMVLVDRVFPKSQIFQVTSDHYQGAIDVAAQLLSHGHRQIGILQGLPDTLPNQERLLGIRDAHRAQEIPWSVKRIAGDQFSEESGYQGTISLLESMPGITVLFAFSNLIALGALKACAERGRCVGEDISLVAFDDHPLMNFLGCPLTSAGQDVKQLGSVAAELIAKQLKSKQRSSERLFRVPCSIVLRKSIVSLRNSSPLLPGTECLELPEIIL